MTHLTRQQVEDALKGLLPPDRIVDLAITDGQVIFAVKVDPAEGAKLEPLRQQAQALVEKIAQGAKVTAILTAEKKSPPELQTRKAAAGTNFGHKISARPVAPRVRHIIAVASGKGGVGKSTVSANLAAAFAQLGKKTGLLDADIYGSSQPRMMNLRSPDQREQPRTNENDMIVPFEASMGGATLKVMSMGFFVPADAPVIWRGPMVHSAIQQLLRDVEWGDLDVLVIDLPPGTGDAQLSLAQYVPLSGAVIVSTPQEVALSEARKAIAMFEKTGVAVLGMVENMSYHECENCHHRENIFDHGRARAAAEGAGIPFLGEVPLLKDVRMAADAGTPLDHRAAEVFKNIAARLWMNMPEKKYPAKSA